MTEPAFQLDGFLRREAPLLGVIAAGALAERRAATDVLRGATAREREGLDRTLARFAHDARTLLGFDRLPDPILAWATLSPEGEPALRRLLPEGRLELRRWEARLTLSRRPSESGLGGVRTGLARLFGGPVLEGDPTREGPLGELEHWAEWRADFRAGRFARVLAVLSGKTLLVALEPSVEPFPVERSHEVAELALLEAVGARPRPPGPTALPCPLDVPSGGRYPKRKRPPKKRPRP